MATEVVRRCGHRMPIVWAEILASHLDVSWLRDEHRHEALRQLDAVTVLEGGRIAEREFLETADGGRVLPCDRDR